MEEEPLNEVQPDNILDLLLLRSPVNEAAIIAALVDVLEKTVNLVGVLRYEREICRGLGDVLMVCHMDHICVVLAYKTGKLATRSGPVLQLHLYLQNVPGL